MDSEEMLQQLEEIIKTNGNCPPSNTLNMYPGFQCDHCVLYKTYGRSCRNTEETLDRVNEMLEGVPRKLILG